MSSVEKADMTEEQVRAEESAQGADVYVHKFRKPFTWEGETYEELKLIQLWRADRRRHGRCRGRDGRGQPLCHYSGIQHGLCYAPGCKGG